MGFGDNAEGMHSLPQNERESEQMATSKTMRQLDLEVLKMDIEWLGAYGEMLLKDPAFKELASRGRDNRINAIFEQLERLEDCAHEEKGILMPDSDCQC